MLAKHVYVRIRRNRLDVRSADTGVAASHPLEMSDGGLSEVEHRVLLELAGGCGSVKTVVHEGPELTDDGVRNALRSAP